MTAETLISDLLAAPLRPDWTIDWLAEEVLCAIATRGQDHTPEFVLDATATADRQTRRLLRPLLACLATKSAAEMKPEHLLISTGAIFHSSGQVPKGRYGFSATSKTRRELRAWHFTGRLHLHSSVFLRPIRPPAICDRLLSRSTMIQCTNS